MKAIMAGAFSLLILFLMPAAASAAVIPVNTTADEYGSGPDCSLREAITAAQDNVAFGGCPAGFAADTITLPGGTYKITRAGDQEDNNATGDFDISGANELEIRAAGPKARVIVDGNGIDRIFHKTSTGKLKLTSLRVTGGDLTAIEDGGGILVGVGMAELEYVTVDRNFSASSAGGIAVYSNLLMVNSTVSGNGADGNGGGIYLAGGSSANVRSSTIYGNTADMEENGVGSGGGFAMAGALSVSFSNVLNVDNNGVSPTPGDSARDCYSGPQFFPRYSMQTQAFGPTYCLVGFNQSSLSVDDAEVNHALEYNGGQTPTHNLYKGSPAIGAGGTAPPDECPGIDQNGRGRVAGKCDIGSTTYIPRPLLLVNRVLPKKKVIRRGKSRRFTVVLRNTGDAPVLKTRVCLVLGKGARKGLRVKGKACRNAGKVAPGKRKMVKIRLAAKPKAKKKKYRVRARAKAENDSAFTRFRVRVK